MRASLNPQADQRKSLFVSEDLEVAKQFGLSSGNVLTPGATPRLDASKGSVHTLTPGEDETITVINAIPGQLLYLIVLTSGVTSRTLTFGTGFKTTATLATGTTSARYFIMTFISDGTNVYEVSRTTAIA